MTQVTDHVVEPSRSVPRIPASAGALIFDAAGRLLILKTNYKKRWSLPGGQVEADGESPWEACQRETLEECGVQVERGELVCVDFLRPRPNRPGGLRFLFDCGALDDQRLSEIRLQPEEDRGVPVRPATRGDRAPDRSRRAAGRCLARRQPVCLPRGRVSAR